MKWATKVKDEAEVNFDKELPDNKHFEDYCEHGGCFCRLKLKKTSRWYKLVEIGRNWF